MKKQWITSLMTSLALLMPSVASAQYCIGTNGGWYAGALGGITDWMGTHVQDAAGDVYDIEWDMGYVAGAYLGYEYGCGWQIEGQFSYHRSEVKKLVLESTHTDVNGNGSMEYLVGMFNLIHSAHWGSDECCLRPFCGVGFGGVYSIFNDQSTGTVYDDEDYVWAYQFIFGIAMVIDECFDLAVEYHNLNIADGVYETAGNRMTFLDWTHAHEVLLTLRIIFAC